MTRRFSPVSRAAAPPIDPLTGPPLALAGRVVTMNRRDHVVRAGVVYIEKGSIVAVRARTQAEANARIGDCSTGACGTGLAAAGAAAAVLERTLSDRSELVIPPSEGRALRGDAVV